MAGVTAVSAGGPGSAVGPARGGITDVHVHIQPWRQLKPDVMAAMRRGKEDHWEFLLALMDDPKALLEVMDRAGVWRVGLVNYPSPDLMGFTDETNAFAARYAEAAPERLLPYGGVHPRFAGDIKGHVDELVELGIARETTGRRRDRLFVYDRSVAILNEGTERP